MDSMVTKQKVAMLIVVCLTQTCHAAEQLLSTNPFAIPVDTPVIQSVSSPVEQETPVKLVLRGTIVSGQQSLANISGVIVSLGEEVNGYKLVGVQQREVVLLRDNSRRILSVDDEQEGGQR